MVTKNRIIEPKTQDVTECNRCNRYFGNFLMRARKKKSYQKRGYMVTCGYVGRKRSGL